MKHRDGRDHRYAQRYAFTIDHEVYIIGGIHFWGSAPSIVGSKDPSTYLLALKSPAPLKGAKTLYSADIF